MRVPFLSRFFGGMKKSKPSAFLDVKEMNRIVVTENGGKGFNSVAPMNTKNAKLIHTNKLDSIVTINGTTVVPQGSSNSRQLMLLDTTSKEEFVIRKVLSRITVALKREKHLIERILSSYAPRVTKFFGLDNEAFQMVDIVKMYDEMTKACMKYGFDNIVISSPEFTVSYIDKRTTLCRMSFVPLYVERLDERDKNADEFTKQFDVDCRTLSVNKYAIPVKSIGEEK